MTGTHIDILLPALIAGMLVLLTHVPLGFEVMRRGIIFLDLAIAQTAAFGVVLAHTVFDVHSHGANEFSTVLAIFSALCGSAILALLRNTSIHIQEACIGILFVMMATGVLLILSADPHGGEQLKTLLIGQILWLQVHDLILLGIVTIAILIVWWIGKRYVSEWLFYPLFAIAVTLSTQVVGVYLVFASLIIPAVCTLTSRWRLVVAYTLGVLGYLTGLIVAALADLPAGAMVVWCLALIAGGYAGVTKLTTAYRQSQS